MSSSGLCTTTFADYLCNHPELSGFVNLYSGSALFDIIDTLTDTQIFIPINDALAATATLDILNNSTLTEIDTYFLYSLVPNGTGTTQCTLLPGYSVDITATTVNQIPLLTVTRINKGLTIYTISGYLVPTTVNPACLPQEEESIE
jgi:hypothetical protein